MNSDDKFKPRAVVHHLLSPQANRSTHKLFADGKSSVSSCPDDELSAITSDLDDFSQSSIPQEDQEYPQVTKPVTKKPLL